MEHHIRILKAQFRFAAFHGEIGIVCGQLALVPSLLLLKSLLRRVGTMAEELAHTPLIRPLFGRRFPNKSPTQRLLDLDLTVLIPKGGSRFPSERNAVASARLGTLVGSHSHGTEYGSEIITRYIILY